MNTILFLSLVVLTQALIISSSAASGAVSPAEAPSMEDLKQPSFQALLKANYKGKQISNDIDRAIERQVKSLSPSLNVALNNCSDRYDNAVSHIGDSIKSLLTTNVNYEDLKTWIDVAASSAGICQQAIRDVTIPAGVGVFQGDAAKNDNAVFSDLCSNALKQVTALQDVVGKPKL